MKNLLKTKKVAELKEILMIETNFRATEIADMEKVADTDLEAIKVMKADLAKSISSIKKMKKAELIEEVLKTIPRSVTGTIQGVCFDTDVDCDIKNNGTAIPSGALVINPISKGVTVGAELINDFLCSAHRDYLIDNVDEEWNVCSLKLDMTSNVLVIRTVADYLRLRAIFGTTSNGIQVEGLNTVSFIDYEVAEKYFDGIFFTSSVINELRDCNEDYALDGINHPTVIMFKGKVSDVTPLIHDDSIFEKITKAIADSHTIHLKRTQYEIIKSSVDNLVWDSENKRYMLPETAGVKVTMSDNRVFRKYSELNRTEVIETENGASIERVFNSVENFLVFSGVPDTKGLKAKDAEAVLAKAQAIVDYVTDYGFFNERTGKTVKVLAQSASQARTGKYYYTSLDVDALREELLCGYKFPNKFVIANKEARNGLAFTSAIPVSLKPNVFVLPDPIEKIKSKVVLPTGVDAENNTVSIFDDATNQVLIKTIEDTVELCPNDGAGLIEVIPACIIAHDLGLVTGKELTFFKNTYTTMADLTVIRNKIVTGEDITSDERRLYRIFNKIPSGLQMRYAGDKGLLVVFPFSEYRKDLAGYDIIEGSNMRKYTAPDYSNISLEIANISHDATDEVQMAYQFIASLNIKSEDLISLVDRKLDELDKDILSNPVTAMKFLGMISKSTDSEEDIQIATNFAKVLATNPDMLADVYIQKGIKKLLATFVFGLGFGKVMVKGSYHFVISDPFHFLGQGAENIEGLTDLSMKAGENYLNNGTGLVACFRSPLIFKSEAQKVNLVKNDKLWFIRDIIVLNPYELTLPAAGGADTDGDKFLVTPEETIVNAISNYDAIPFDAGLKASPIDSEEVDAKQLTLEYFKGNSKRSQIGLLTNYATTFRDLENQEDGVNARNYDFTNTILGLRFLQGWEIDRAKTGAKVVIPDGLSCTAVPHWKYALGEFNKDKDSFISKFGVVDYTKGKDVYMSCSPLGKLFDHVRERAKDFLGNHKQGKNFTSALASHVDVAEMVRVLPAVKELEHNYRIELATLRDSGIVDDKKLFNTTMDEITDRYTSLVKSLSDDYSALAVACYNCAYVRENNETKSRSFPWVVMFDELLDVIGRLQNSARLVSLPRYDEEITSVKVSNTGIMFINDEKHRACKLAPGVKDLITLGDRQFIYERVFAPVQEYIKEVPQDKLFQITLGGFARQGMNALQVAELLKANTFSIQLIDNALAIVVNNQVISGIIGSNVLTAVNLVNQEFTMISFIDPTYTPVKNNPTGEKALRKTLTITFKGGNPVPDDKLIKPAVIENTVEDNGISYSDYENADYGYEPSYGYENINYSYDPSYGYEADYSVSCEPVYSCEEAHPCAQPVNDILNSSIIDQICLNFDNVWDIDSITPPSNATKVEYAISNTLANGVIGEITLYSGTTGFKFSVVKNNRELSIVSIYDEIKPENAAWMKRFIAYKLFEQIYA